ncbi:MAG: TlpA family protein disulfide reductase [Myxococcales bacterium]|nr:TlpA family protein disulfide reductase [Myxococcales bacterium]
MNPKSMFCTRRTAITFRALFAAAGVAAAGFAAAGFAAAGFAAAGCGGARLPSSSPSVLLGRDLPRFSRASVAGDPSGTKGVEGKVVVVKFFAKFCEPCKKTLSEAQSLHEGSSDVVVIGVAEDESANDVAEVVEQFRLTFPVIHDRENVISGRYRVSALPSTFVADVHGRVIWVGGPEQAPGDLDDAVRWARSQR